MAIKHQDLKNLVMQELLNETINNEGVTDWLRAQSSKALTGAGRALTGAGEKIKPEDPKFVKNLDKIGDFLQMAQRDRDITNAIMQTELGKKVFSSQEKSLEEALGQDFTKMMKDKKVTPQEVSSFIAAMNIVPKAKKMLDGLGVDIEVSDQDIVGSSTSADISQAPATVASEPTITADKPAAPPAPPEQTQTTPVATVQTKKANIKFLTPIEDKATVNPEVIQKAGEETLDKANRFKELKNKFDSGKSLSNKEKDEMIATLGIGKDVSSTKKQPAKKQTIKKQPIKKQATAQLQKGIQRVGGRLGESLKDILMEEIFNAIVGKNK